MIDQYREIEEHLFGLEAQPEEFVFHVPGADKKYTQVHGRLICLRGSEF
ncbi:hypothetical protein [Salimicrobium album]|nr:hypothetical protein [Salimicrobium album]